jgi:DNA-binding CsgD family transcriptional regulator
MSTQIPTHCVVPVVSNHLAGTVHRRSAPGILLFTQQRELLFITREASNFCTQINRAKAGVTAMGVIPQDVCELLEEIVSVFRNPHDTKHWEEYECRRVVETAASPVLLRGLGLPDHHDYPNGGILVVMERVGYRQEGEVKRAFCEYELTERERQVVEQLFKGLTNKEIATNLDITEQTVKDHLKRIMHRIGVTTRTSLVTRLLSITDFSLPSGTTNHRQTT